MKSLVSVLVILAVAVGEARAQESIEVSTLAALTGDQDSDRGKSGPRPDEDAWRGSVRLFLGAKDLNEAEWAPVDEQGEFAFLIDAGRADWDVRLAIDFRFASSDDEDLFGVNVSSGTFEINIGVRKVFDTGSIVMPYLGGGLAFGGATLEIDDAEESDEGIGIWFDAGVDFKILGPITLGLEVSLSSIPVDIAGVDANAGGIRIGLTIGYTW